MMMQKKLPEVLSRPLVVVEGSNHPHFNEFYMKYSKRWLDLALSALILVIAAPIMVFVAILAVLDGGPALFGHERIGQCGQRFKCLKFRTMRTDSATILAHLLASDPKAAAEWARDHKLAHDPRITRIGRFLRRTSLDELPQLINVIRGEMSLVGPRPVTEEELDKYSGHRQKYLALRPGLTGIWQVHGRGTVSYEERVDMDVHYYRTASFFGDMVLLFQTAAVVVERRGQ